MWTNGIFGAKLKITRGELSVFDWFEKIRTEFFAEETGLRYTIKKSHWDSSEKYPCEFIRVNIIKEYDGKEEEFTIQINDNIETIGIMTSCHHDGNNNIFKLMIRMENFLKEEGFELVDILMARGY